MRTIIPAPWRSLVALRLLDWADRVRRAQPQPNRPRLCVLLFCHGYSLAHTLRPAVLAQALRARGHRVVLAGRGPHMRRVREFGFRVEEVETLPQDRIDAAVQRGEYRYYDLEWIDRCVQSERSLIRATGAGLVVHDFRPTAAVSARLEGVDDARITQAYNQPRYAYRLAVPDDLASETGPFAAYLAARAGEVRPQRSLSLLADIPELHPPAPGDVGYYYVGPLLAVQPEPRAVPMLDAGWDPAWPLVYVTCGSSGRPPVYLDELAAAAACLPIRVAISTAGRWHPGALPANVRAFEYLPAAWILRRAAVLAGVPGIGTIYQALACAVPIVGAPEHLDQEYHLNRVRDLGLGCKLDRRALTGSSLLDAISGVLAEREVYHERCRPFAEAVKRWRGGEEAADVLERYLSTRDDAYPSDSASAVPAAHFERYLTSTAPPQLTPAALRSMLRSAVEQGMPTVRRNGETAFDPYTAWNWLYERQPEFFAADYRAQRDRRRLSHQVGSGGVSLRASAQRYRLRYTLTLDPSMWGGRRVKVFLPVPIARPHQQDEVEILACRPPEMASVLAERAGFFYGYTTTCGDTPLEFGYEATARVHERRCGSLASTAPPPDVNRWLQLPEGLALLPEIVRFRSSLRHGVEQPERRARETYQHLLARTRFRKTRDRGSGLAYAAQHVLRDRVGHCVSLTRTFIALCRCDGIPARELTGALLGYPAGPELLVRQAFCEPVFGHTWAEIWLAGSGWTPVEFQAITIGANADTGCNVRDERLRAWMRSEGPAYEAYYFGNTDHQRVVCSNSAKTIPPFLVEDVTRPVGDPGRWHCPQDLPYTCRLETQPV